MSALSRRGFLRTTAAGGLLTFPAVQAPAGERRLAAQLPGAGQSAGAAAPLVVITAAVSPEVNPRAPSWGYIDEILRRAGVFYQAGAPDDLVSLPGRRGQVVLLAGNLPLTQPQRDALTTWVRAGGALLGIGGTSGLDEVFGVQSTTTCCDGWLKIAAAAHPVTAGLRSTLHVFGGCVAKPGSATRLADLQPGSYPQGSAILENRCGEGLTLLLGPDLIFSIVHLQQGVRVLQDGQPAPDATAELRDGILKAEDGLVLDWQRDRQPMQPEGTPAFLEPVSDELREIILRGIFHLARRQHIALPVLWYWPQGQPAVGHISHDTDGNEPQKASALLEVMNRAGVKSTWCTIYPGGYPREFYGTLVEQGFEVALHYDAKTGEALTSWSKENFFRQRDWLLQEASLREITSNKNHYTRWEGRLEFFRWCEEAGIATDQTRGPSKKGTIGFPLGGSQPYYPWDDERETPRRINVLEVNMMTQDLVVVCPAQYGQQLLDSAARQHGVAHFLFHPAHILKPQVADAICALADYGRKQGLQWWTSRQIVDWETGRRAVTAHFEGRGQVLLRAAKPLRQATLLVLRSGATPAALKIDGRSAQAKSQRLYGFDFDAVTLDLAAQQRLQIG